LFETDHIENYLNHVDVAICEFYVIPNPQIQTLTSAHHSEF
jgi:hypothetical protein